MDCRIKLGLPIKTEGIFIEKPKTILQKLFRLKPTRKKIGIKDFYADGRVEVRYNLGGIIPSLIEDECYCLTPDELKKLLKEYYDSKRSVLEKIKSI